ncbi:MAG TPA: glycosyltransferase family 2 protein [Candidatus Saccharibacteria bacterium]|nr:glycosyltransferase family 2 protein [Candidatus Saccharibacteria bacterium]HMT56070.1 glycosyltransferase family 2 protein [Candidatus Saccharibacteria bacterium]
MATKNKVAKRNPPKVSRMKPLVSVVVLNWNGKRFVDPFLNAYYQTVYPSNRLELVFIDNNSTDESVAYAKKKVRKSWKTVFVQNDNNYGYAGGNNKGIPHTSGDYILIVNNDLELAPQLISELVSTAQKTDADAVVPKLMFKNKPGYINNAGSILESDQAWPVRERGYDQKDEGQFDKTEEVTAVCGACVLFKRSFLQDVGLFDAKFFMYFEDSDLSWRGQRAGKLFYYEPKAVAYHVHTGSSKEGSPLFNFYVGRNRVLIMAKNAQLKLFFKVLGNTLYWHLVFRIWSLLKSAITRNGRKHAVVEFWRSQKMLWSLFSQLPRAFAKRWHIIKEETL